MSQLETKPDSPPASINARATGAEIAFPSPQDHPAADVLIYDGHCVFCAGQVKNLMRFDGKNRLAFVSLHDSFVSENFPDMSHDQLMKQLYLIPYDADVDGYSTKRLGGAAAIRYLSRRLPKLWIFAPLMHIPFSLPIWQRGYDLVAKRRYKLMGKTGEACDENGSCELHFGDKS